MYVDLVLWNVNKFVIISNSFLVECLGLSKCNIMPSDVWFLPVQCGCPLFFPLALLLWPRLPILYWIQVVEMDILAFFQILEKMVFNFFFPFNMVLAIGLSYMACLILRPVYSVPCLIGSLSQRDIKFYRILFQHLLK